MMEAALSQRDPKLVTSALRRCVLNAERCIQRMRLSDIVLSLSSLQRSYETNGLQKTPQSDTSVGNESFYCFNVLL